MVWVRNPSDCPQQSPKLGMPRYDFRSPRLYVAQDLANGATIVRPLAATPWGTKDFYVEDPDGYIISFGGRPAES